MTRDVKIILVGWGLAVLVLSGLVSLWVDHNRRQAERDLCELVSVFRGGPAPVGGPAGDRGREIQRALEVWAQRREC